jgi:hypothetical protein
MPRLSPLHTTRRPRYVLNYFRERSEDVVKIGIVCITIGSPYDLCTSLAGSYCVHHVPTKSLSRALPRVQYVFAFKLHPYYVLTTTRKTFLRVHHAPLRSNCV